MISKERMREILRIKANYIVRSLLEIGSYYGLVKCDGGARYMKFVPYQFLKRVLYITIEDYGELGIGYESEMEEQCRTIDQIVDEVLECFFVVWMSNEGENGLVCVKGYFTDEQEGKLSLFFSTIICKLMLGVDGLDENEKFFVEFIEQYGRKEWIPYFAIPGPDLRNVKYEGWHERFQSYMAGVENELKGYDYELRNAPEEALTLKFKYVSGTEAGEDTNDQ